MCHPPVYTAQLSILAWCPSCYMPLKVLSVTLQWLNGGHLAYRARTPTSPRNLHLVCSVRKRNMGPLRVDPEVWSETSATEVYGKLQAFQ